MSIVRIVFTCCSRLLALIPLLVPLLPLPIVLLLVPFVPLPIVLVPLMPLPLLLEIPFGGRTKLSILSNKINNKSSPVISLDGLAVLEDIKNGVSI